MDYALVGRCTLMSAEKHAAAISLGSEQLRSWRSVLVVLAVSIALHVAVGALTYRDHPERSATIDTPSYVYPAGTLLHQGRFLECCGEAPMFFRTPGYPAFLAAVHALCGDGDYPVLLLQSFLSAATAWFVFLAAATFCSGRVSLTAALLTAADPVSFAVSQQLLSDSLFTFLLVVCIWLTLRALLRHHLAGWTAAGGMLGLSALVRPVVYYLIIPIVLIAVLGRRTDRARRVAAVVCLFLSYSLVVGLWQFRNKVLLGTWEFSGVRAVNIFLYQAGGVLAAKEGVTVNEAQNRLVNEIHVSRDEILSPRVNARLLQKGISVISDEPLIYTKLVVRGDFLFLFAPGYETLRLYFGPIFFHIIIQYSFLYLAILYLGVIWSLRSSHDYGKPAWLLVLVVLYFVVATGSEGYCRYRIPAIPALSTLAALGFARLVRDLHLEKGTRITRGTANCAAVVSETGEPPEP